MKIKLTYYTTLNSWTVDECGGLSDDVKDDIVSELVDLTNSDELLTHDCRLIKKELEEPTLTEIRAMIHTYIPINTNDIISITYYEQ